MDQLIADFELIEVNSVSDTIIFRSSVKDADEASSFIQRYSALNNCNYIVYTSRKNPIRYVFQKTWICQLNKKNKLSTSQRNRNCQATINIKIKLITKHTRKTDEFLRRVPPLCAIITIQNKHTPECNSAVALKYLRVSEEVKDKFNNYFNDGMPISEAIAFHESTLLLNNYSFEVLANAQQNPTRKQVEYLFHCWRETNLGEILNPFEKLKEKMSVYNSNSEKVFYKDSSPWAVLIITDIMKRAHDLSKSAEIIFCDSSASVDSGMATLTVLLTATAVGAIPIALLIHENQSFDSYHIAFSLLQKTHPNCFGGNDCPTIFMTDDGNAEKLALRNVWPQAKQFLCHFHVIQAEWRWLHNNNNQIEASDRSRLIKMFMRVMYSKTLKELDAAIQECQNVSYDNFKERLSQFLKRKEEWVLFYRLDYTKKSHNINNYSEITIRIIKDIVLHRTKAFNIVALTQFLLDGFESYLRKKLLDLAYSRNNKAILNFNCILNEVNSVNSDKIENINHNEFLVPSTSRESVWYMVDSAEGICTCPFGITGKFCKHQASIFHYKRFIFPNMPRVLPSQKFALAQLALGKSCPNENFFNNFENVEVYINPFEMPCSSHSMEKDTQKLDDGDEISALPQNIPDGSENEAAEILHMTSQFLPNLPPLIRRKYKNMLKKCKNQEQFNSFIINCISKRKYLQQKKIKVQPTSVTRRRQCTTRRNDQYSIKIKEK